MSKRAFQRSSRDCLIAGVCGGIAEYLSIPSWLIRIIMVVLAFVYGLGILLYIILWLSVPKNPSTKKIDPNCIDADFEVKE